MSVVVEEKIVYKCDSCGRRMSFDASAIYKLNPQTVGGTEHLCYICFSKFKYVMEKIMGGDVTVAKAESGRVIPIEWEVQL